jgi:ABC-2 type transport system permease protein
MKTIVLVKTLFKQSLINLRRYLFDTLSGVITVFLFFLILFYGAKAFGGDRPGFGTTLSALVVGYMVWMMSIFAYSSVSQNMIEEAQLGTLEQIAMSPLGFGRVVVVRTAVGFVIQLAWVILILFLMMASTGKWLHLDFLSILPLMIVTGTGILGIGLALGGLAVVVKRVQSALQVLQIAFIALVAVPVDSVPWMKYLPLAWGNYLLRGVMVESKSIFSFSSFDLLFLLGNAAVYFAFGLFCFKLLEKVARNRALLGHY